MAETEPGPQRPRKASRHDPVMRMRAAAFGWLGKDPVTSKAPRTGQRGKRPSAQQLRKSAWLWFHSASAKASREARGPSARRDLVAQLRKAAWLWLKPRSRAQEQAARPATSVLALSGVARKHLKGVIEALIFVSERPISVRDLARLANAEHRVVRALCAELVVDYEGRGVRLDEVAGGFVFRTSPAYAPFVREVAEQKPVRMSRAQLETLAIVAYRQPITRPEIDDVRGVDSGAALKSLLERDLVRILGKKEEPGRPVLYGTTSQFLEFFGLKKLSELPTLSEFTELTNDSRRAYEREMGEALPLDISAPPVDAGLAGAEGELRGPSSAANDVMEGPEVVSDQPETPSPELSSSDSTSDLATGDEQPGA